jgi:hypothetical protein
MLVRKRYFGFIFRYRFYVDKLLPWNFLAACLETAQVWSINLCYELMGIR